MDCEIGNFFFNFGFFDYQQIDIDVSDGVYLVVDGVDCWVVVVQLSFDGFLCIDLVVQNLVF